MVDALLDLVLRPGETELPPVRVLLSVVVSVHTLLGGDVPGEVDGKLLSAEMVRQPVQALAGRGLLPADDALTAGDATGFAARPHAVVLPPPSRGLHPRPERPTALSPSPHPPA
jgi:hypothetical protein